MQWVFRGVICSLLLIVLPATVTGQVANVMITEQKLGAIVMIDHSIDSLQPNESERSEVNPPQIRWEINSKLKLRNMGKATITSIRWAVIFYWQDDKTKRDRATPLSFKTRKLIRPGKEASVSEWASSSLVKSMRQAKRQGTLRTKYQLMNIEYEDGTAWAADSLIIPPS